MIRLTICPHEGSVIESDPSGHELRHIRECAARGQCTRGAVDPAVPSCQTCDLHPEGGATPLPTAKSSPVAYCRFRGEDRVFVAGSNRDWRKCGHPDQPLGENCCRCSGCGPKCVGYQVSDPEEACADEIVVDQGAGGLGDGCQGLWVVGGLAEETGRMVRYNCGKTALPWMDLFEVPRVKVGLSAKSHNEWPTKGQRQMNVGYTQERVDRISTPRWRRYMGNVGTKRMVKPPLRDEEAVRKSGQDFLQHIALCPWSSGRWSEWSVHAWLDLESRLNAAGYPTVVLHKSMERCEKFRGRKLVGRSPEEVAGCLLNCRAAVGIDSGLAHLAGTLGCPTVVLGGATRVEHIYGCYPTATFVQGELPCSGCFNLGPDINDHCRDNCSNLHSVTPRRVFDHLLERLIRQDTQDRTLISPDRLKVIRQEVRRTNHLDGDVAELGVFRGGSARLIRKSMTGGVLHLFDTFEGLPQDDTVVGAHHLKGEFACGLDDVRSFVGTDSVEYHVGRFGPEAVPTAPVDARYRFVHLDGDLLATTRDALAYFWPRMVQGGVIVLDDYLWVRCPGVAMALEELLPDVPVESPARYQGIVRKP